MLKRTCLYDQHRAWGARMVEFGGFEMPVQYAGVVAEHTAVRTAAGLFDISHMGRFLITGDGARDFLQYIATCDVAMLAVGQSTYGLMCTPEGGIVDDIFVYRLPTEYLVVVNAANREKDWHWMQQHAAVVNARLRDEWIANWRQYATEENVAGEPPIPPQRIEVTLEDVSEKWAMLALQGPAAEALFMQDADMQHSSLRELPFHEIAMFDFCGINGMVSRTGYTGEDGFELFFDATRAPQVWETLLGLGDAGSIKPCGLGARDSLRFEPCLALYGHEIDMDINPYEARLGWVVKLDKGDFVGRAALQAIKEHGVSRRLTGFEIVGRGVARQNYPIHDLAGNPIGYVTTGMPAPTLGKRLGLGYVPRDLSTPDSEFDVIIRDKPVRARAVKTPFYKPRYKKPERGNA